MEDADGQEGFDGASSRRAGTAAQEWPPEILGTMPRWWRIALVTDILIGMRSEPDPEVLPILLDAYTDEARARREVRHLPDGRIEAGKHWSRKLFVVTTPDGKDDGRKGDDVCIEMPFL